jgi:hypothetical protein
MIQLLFALQSQLQTVPQECLVHCSSQQAGELSEGRVSQLLIYNAFNMLAEHNGRPGRVLLMWPNHTMRHQLLLCLQ